MALPINNKIIVMIFIVLLLLCFFKVIYRESYDGRISKIKNLESCADLASSLYDVTAIGFDPSNNNCYISKTPLTRPPIQTHPYHNDFKLTDVICNKTNFIRSPYDIKDKNTIIGNRLYLCYNNNTTNLDDAFDQYYFEKNKPIKLITNQELEKLPTHDETIFRIDWPTEKAEINDIKIDYQKHVLKNINWKPVVNIKQEELNPYKLYVTPFYTPKNNICINK
jgi:hypothetical protein